MRSNINEKRQHAKIITNYFIIRSDIFFQIFHNANWEFGLHAKEHLLARNALHANEEKFVKRAVINFALISMKLLTKPSEFGM